MAWRSHATWTDWKKPIHTVCKHTAFVYCVNTPFQVLLFFFIHLQRCSFIYKSIHFYCVWFFFSVRCVLYIPTWILVVACWQSFATCRAFSNSEHFFLFITLFLLRHYCPFTAMLNVPNKCDNWNVRPVRVYFRFTAVRSQPYQIEMFEMPLTFNFMTNSFWYTPESFHVALIKRRMESLYTRWTKT